MSLGREIRQQMLAFVNGELDERDLALWLAGVGRSVDVEDGESQALWEDASALLAEVSGIEHDPRLLREDFAELLHTHPVVDGLSGPHVANSGAAGAPIRH